MQEDIFEGMGVEIELASPSDFNKVRETLTRIGIASKHSKTLYQSCHILHKRGRYAIMSFKELFELDGRYADVTADDVARRNRIAALLEEWGLVRIVDRSAVTEMAPMSGIKIIHHREKADWVLQPKHGLGQPRRFNNGDEPLND